MRSCIGHCRGELDKRYATADELLFDLEHYIYHSGYGPTNETMGRYMRELFGQSGSASHEEPGCGSTRFTTEARHQPGIELTSRMRSARSKPPVTLGLVQTSCSANPQENLKKTLAAATRAVKQGANIICTQELFRSQYFCQSEDHEYFKLAEPIPGPTTAAFQKFARQHQVGGGGFPF